MSSAVQLPLLRQRVLLGSMLKMTTALLHVMIQHGVHRQKYLWVQLYSLMKEQHVEPRVVTWTIVDGRTDSQTMATGSSMTWMHCSVRYEVTWG
jgi:hypothetical protein